MITTATTSTTTRMTMPSSTSRTIPVQTTMTDSANCHTAIPGEKCYEEITWAQSNGIFAHPEWYPGLTAQSSLSDFQRAVFESGDSACQAPCASGDSAGQPPAPA